MKPFFFVIALFCFLRASSQEYLGVGTVLYPEKLVPGHEQKTVPYRLGIDLPFLVGKVYISLSTNLRMGKGKEIDQPIDWRMSMGKFAVRGFNVGYRFGIHQFSLIPYVGWFESEEIIQSNYGGSKKFYTGDYYSFLNYGALVAFSGIKNTMIYLGSSHDEIVKVGIMLKLHDRGQRSSTASGQIFR